MYWRITRCDHSKFFQVCSWQYRFTVSGISVLTLWYTISVTLEKLLVKYLLNKYSKLILTWFLKDQSLTVLSRLELIKLFSLSSTLKDFTVDWWPLNVCNLICLKLNQVSRLFRPISCSQYANQFPLKCLFKNEY